MPENETQETFTVSLMGAGIDVKREVSASKLALVMSIIMGNDPTEGVAVGVPNVSAPIAPARVSLREFLDNAKATTKPDQIVAIGQYMAAQEGKDTFSRDDIKARFQSARERLPSNFPRDFSAAIGKGMIAEDHAKAGQYYVTKTGAQAIERRFGAQN
ncbi:hypothetical protein FJ986_25410 [Mesorhizobium sp. B1-1-1]|uniref:hypothetical protein n=1 Tax=Mesorhizobium sp. B1-1-1 TaxID=2589983 RepID=UPI001129232F|nr:hypothetical protein [Mesorhizobium sp. B1-1-1]TPN62579.1 hypothetical protein FJ986_25410 [Mesorhizobium sp. B1-1-1]